MNTGLNKKSQLLIYAVACVWFIYVFRHYLPELDRDALATVLSKTSNLLTASGVFDILLVVWLWTVAYLAGRKFVARLGVHCESGAERMALASAAGLALLSLVVLILAALKVLYKPVAYSLLLVPTAVWFAEFRLLIVGFQQSLARRVAGIRFSARQVGHACILAYIAVILGIVLLSALGPEIEYDALVYHLTAPKAFASTHGLRAIPDIPFSFYPKNIEMLFALAMRLHNHIAAKLVHYLLGLLAIQGAYALGARFFSRTVGLLAAAVLASSPLFIWEMRTANIDLGLTLYVFLSLYAAIIWIRSGNRPWFWLAAFFMAFSLGVKYHALFALVSLAALIFLRTLIAGKSLRHAFRPAADFVLLSAPGLLPWALINLYYTGNPVFPFLNNIFRSHYWTEWHTQLEYHKLMKAGLNMTLSNWWAPVTVFWDMIGLTDAFHGNIGPFFLLLIPLLILRRRVALEIKLILTFSLFYSFLWFFTAHLARFYLPVLPGLAVAACYGAVYWLKGVEGIGFRVPARIAATLLALMFVFNSPFFEDYGANSRYGAKILETLPVKYLLGIESREEYLTRNVRNYGVVQYLNQLPGQKKVFFCWNDTQPNAFFVNGEAAYLYSPFAPKLSDDDPDQLHRVLRENGVTHLIVGRHRQGAYLMSSPEREFVRRYLKEIYQRNATILYELSPERLQQDIVSYDFLLHIEEAQISMPNEPADKSNDKYRAIMGIGDDLRYALVSFPLAEVRFSLTLCERPVLKFAVGQMFPDCTGKGTFQVWIVGPDREGRMLYVRQLDAQNNRADVGWFEAELDLAEYASQPVEILFKTISVGGSCNWYLWSDPVIINKSNSALQTDSGLPSQSTIHNPQSAINSHPQSRPRRLRKTPSSKSARFA